MKCMLHPACAGRFVCFVAILWCVGLSTRAQESAPPPADNPPAAQEAASETAPPATDKTLDELLAEWAEMDKRLKETEAAAQADGAPETARQAYIDVVDQAYKLIDQIKSSALAAVTKDPKDEKASKTLIGIMVNASRRADGDAEVLNIADALFAAGATADWFAPALASSRLTPFGKDLFNEILIRQKEHEANDLPQVKLTTSKGEIVLELFENQAPNSVANFLSLVKAKFYDGTKFHRVIEGFMAQGGDPKGTGEGGPGYSIKCECYEPNARRHFSGTLSMAHAGRDTGGSQFFITFRATSALDGRHTAFGRVLSGQDVLEKLTRNYTDSGPIPGADADSIVTAEVIRDRGHEYVPQKVGGDAPK